MRHLLASLATIAVAVGVAPSAFAQGDITADVSLARADRLVNAVTLEDLKAIVASQGDAIDAVSAEDVAVDATSATYGLLYSISGRACDTDIRPGCLGIIIQISFDGDEKITYEKLNQANYRWAAVSTLAEGKIGTTDSSLLVSRYVILDGGMNMGNVAENLTNALAIAGDVADFIWENGDTAAE